MRTWVIYHRDTGHTRELAEYNARQTGADRVQVRSRFPYNHLFRMIEGDQPFLPGITPPPLRKKNPVIPHMAGTGTKANRKEVMYVFLNASSRTQPLSPLSAVLP